MKKLTPEVLNESILLVKELRSGKLNDKELSAVIVRLNDLLLDPHWFDYAVDHNPELSPDEVVKRAFRYRPIEL